MSVLKEVYNYLRKIKSEEISFQLLLNKGLKDIKQNEAFIIKDSLKSIVNKYFFSTLLNISLAISTPVQFN